MSRLIEYQKERDEALKGVFLSKYKIGADMGELGFQLMIDTDTVDSSTLGVLQKNFHINTIKVNLRNGTLDFYLNGPLEK